MDQKPRPTVKLIGADGNVFNIIGLCTRAARRASWTREQVDELRTALMGQDSYDHVLAYVMEHFEVE